MPTIDERIADLQNKQKQLKERERKLKAQQRKNERKERTKHLIEIGGAVYKVLKEDTVDGGEFNNDDVENLIAFLKNQNKRGNYFSIAMHRTPKNSISSEKDMIKC